MKKIERTENRLRIWPWSPPNWRSSGGDWGKGYVKYNRSDGVVKIISESFENMPLVGFLHTCDCLLETRRSATEVRVTRCIHTLGIRTVVSRTMERRRHSKTQTTSGQCGAHFTVAVVEETLGKRYYVFFLRRHSMSWWYSYSLNWNRSMLLIYPLGTVNLYPSRRRSLRFHYALKIIQRTQT